MYDLKLLLAPAIYMLQVYDRVLATGGKLTLLFVTIALAVALITLAGLDAIRNRLLVRASARLDSLLSPLILNRMLSSGGRDNVQALRDFDTIRRAVASPASAALFELPWAPIFITLRSRTSSTRATTLVHLPSRSCRSRRSRSGPSAFHAASRASPVGTGRLAASRGSILRIPPP